MLCAREARILKGNFDMLNAILSLVFFAAAIAIGCVLKKNTGIVSIALAFVLAKITKIPDKQVLSSFDSKLFIMLLGIMLLFGIAQNNRTLDILAKKSIALCRGKVKLIPIVLFVFSAVVSAVGPGLISTTGLMSALAMALAIKTGVEPISLLLFAAVGAFAGGLSPITPSGIVAITNAENSGVSGITFPIAVWMFIVMLFCALVLYFFIFKWHKYKQDDGVQLIDAGEDEKFELKHIFTIVGFVVVPVLQGAFGFDIGLTAFAVSCILFICGFADEGAVVKKIPWNTLLMITGVGMLISLVTELGGADLVSEGILVLMNKTTAPAILTIISGVMSWVSSASGVVMPTWIPQVPTFVAQLPGVSATALVTGVCIGANAAAFSPLSSCGGLMLSAYSTSEVATPEGRNKMFSQLFFFSAACIGASAVFALIGCFAWF